MRDEKRDMLLPSLRATTVSKLLSKRRLTEGQEILVLKQAIEVDQLDFPTLLSAKSQVLALSKMDLDVTAWRMRLMELESVRMGPERAPLKSYLLKFSRGFPIIDEIMKKRFDLEGAETRETVLRRGNPADGTIIRFHQLAPMKHGMDPYTIEVHAAYQQKMIEKLSELKIEDIFFQEPWGVGSSDRGGFFRQTPSSSGEILKEIRQVLKAFKEELPKDILDVFPQGFIPPRLTFRQKVVLACCGAEKLYAALNPAVRLRSCMTAGECRELAEIIGIGREKGSAAFASRYILLKVVKKIDAFLNKRKNATVALSINGGHEFSETDMERFTSRPLYFMVGWPLLYTAADWDTPNALRKALANIEDPMKQERIVHLADAIPLASYQHLNSGLARRLALPKLVGDITEIKGSDEEEIAEYLLEFTPDVSLRRDVRGMQEKGRGVFRFINASILDPSSFREAGQPWPLKKRIAA